MSCHLCSTSFSVFKKEYGCKNCGYSFCGKCCSKKMPLPNLGTSKQLVCQQCFDSLTSRPKNNATSFASSSGHSLPPKDSSHSSKLSDATPSQKYEGLSKEDAELLLRLDKLKQNSSSGITTSDIEARLARLKGVDPEQKPITIYKCSKPLTQVEQTDLLFQQMKEELAIDNLRPSAEQEVAERLQHLKGYVDKSPKIQNTSEASRGQNDLNKISGDDTDSTAYNNIDLDEVNAFMQKVSQESDQQAKKGLHSLQQDTEIQDYLSKFKQQPPKKSKAKEININDNDGYSSEDNEEESTKKLIQQIIAESDLEHELEKTNIDSSTFSTVKKQNSKQNKVRLEEEEEEEELPWCSICNEDARLRCHGCDGDLYCRRCFKSCHDEFEIHDHTTSPFKGKI